MRLDDHEHIVQVIFYIVDLCRFDGNFQILSGFKFIRTVNLDIQ